MVNLTSRFWLPLRLNFEDLRRMKLEKISHIVCPKPCLFPKLPNRSFDASFPFFRFSSGEPVVRPGTAYQQDSFVGFNYYRASSIVVCAGNTFTLFEKVVFYRFNNIDRDLFSEILKSLVNGLLPFFGPDQWKFLFFFQVINNLSYQFNFPNPYINKL